MKQSILKIVSASAVICALSAVTACEGDLSGESAFVNQDAATATAFDAWKYQNFVIPYNIDLKYRMEDIESDYDYTLVPAEYEKSVQLAHIVKYCWLEAYDQVAGTAFTRKYTPKVIHFIGSPAYNDNGSMMLGNADGGMKITLYGVNDMQISEQWLNIYYFRTMHHEFAHILHQTKNYDPAFDRISEGNYVRGNWAYHSEGEARRLGFVSTYARSEPAEDIAELTAIYITKSPLEWDAYILGCGDEGRAIINRKLDIVRKYMQEAWGIDIDRLRFTMLNRMRDVVGGQIDLNAL